MGVAIPEPAPAGCATFCWHRVVLTLLLVLSVAGQLASSLVIVRGGNFEKLDKLKNLC